MTTIIKKDGTRKAVKVNGFVSEKAIAVYDRQTKSYTEKEKRGNKKKRQARRRSSSHLLFIY